jgi:hypothetical protein
VVVVALTRNSRAVAAREKARSLARAAQEREAVLLSLAEEYFVLTGEAEALRDEAADKGARLIEAAKVKAAELAAVAGTEAAVRLGRTPEVVARMLETGASRADVAARLELSVSTVRKIDIDRTGAVAPADQSDDASGDSGPAEAWAEHSDEREHREDVSGSGNQEHGVLREPVPVG